MTFEFDGMIAFRFKESKGMLADRRRPRALCRRAVAVIVAASRYLAEDTVDAAKRPREAPTHA